MIPFEAGEAGMERGPLALFGAIVAVGLGPAMWMGVQLGGVQVAPTTPPVVSEQRPGDGRDLLGGTGAGVVDESADETSVIDTAPRGKVLPLTKSPSAKPSPSATSAAPTPSESPEPSATSDDPSVPPTESTSRPTDEPTDPSTGGGTTDEPTAPAPVPPTEDEPIDPDDPATGDGELIAAP